MRPQRLQWQRVKGWHPPAHAVYVGRGKGPRGQWGNPFRVGIDGTSEECVRLFEACYQHDIRYQAAVSRELAGKGVLCWCMPGVPCHADVLLRWANSPMPTAWQCACGYTYTCETSNPEHCEAAASHEAGHAVMRWLRGYPLGPVCIHLDGTGLCHVPTPGRRIGREDAVLMLLAGPISEVGLLADIDLDTSQSDDLDKAREALTPDYVRIAFSAQTSGGEALRHYYDKARDLLLMACELVTWVAEALLDVYVLSAEDLLAMCERWEAEQDLGE